jgi:hypothetical protein
MHSNKPIGAGYMDSNITSIVGITFILRSFYNFLHGFSIALKKAKK